MQKPDFRHYDQSGSTASEPYRALLWIPARSAADAQSARRYAAKQLSGIYRNACSAGSRKNSINRKNPQNIVHDTQK